MTDKGKMLEGWKEISNFLGVSDRTARRWQKENGMPVYQTQKGKKVFAFENEILEWLSNRNKVKKSKLHLITLVAGVILSLLFSYLVYNNTVLKERTPQKLFWKLDKLGGYYILDLFDSNGEKIKTISFKTIKKLESGEHPSWFDTGDINGDFLDDFVYFIPDKKSFSKLKIYLNKGDGTLSFYKEKEFNEAAIFEGKKLNLNHLHLVKLVDLNNDGKNEIILSLNHYYLYPTVLLAYDYTLQKRYLKISHPGWFRNAIAKDLNNDGINELYLAGTNNFLGKEKSEAIGIAIEGKWETGGSIAFQDISQRKLNKSINNHYKVVYIRFGYNQDITHYVVWQFSTFRYIPKEDNTVTYACDLILTNKLQSRKDLYELINLRDFIFSYMLKKCASSFWNTAYIEKMDLKIKQQTITKLMNVHYFNGKKWQKQFCYYP